MKKIIALLTVLTLVAIIFIAMVLFMRSDGLDSNDPLENVEKPDASTNYSETHAKVKKNLPTEYTYVPTIDRKEKDKDSTFKKEHDTEELKRLEKTGKKSKGKKGFQKISLGDNVDIYLGDNGKAWYVQKDPDGKFFKAEIEIDEKTGEITFLKELGENVPKVEKIPLGENDTLYITDKGEQWHVSEKPDGETVKERVEVDENTGEMKVIESYSSGKGKNSSPEK